MISRSPASLVLLTALAGLGCAVSEPLDSPPGSSDAAGSGDQTAAQPSPPYMPPAPKPHVSADDLAIVAAWIAGGALNN
jgi:hypothetical protein